MDFEDFDHCVWKDKYEAEQAAHEATKAEYTKYKTAVQNLFDDPVGYMEGKSKHWKHRAEKAEAELAALKERLESAPVRWLIHEDCQQVLNKWSSGTYEKAGENMDLLKLYNKRVRIVKEEE